MRLETFRVSGPPVDSYRQPCEKVRHYLRVAIDDHTSGRRLEWHHHPNNLNFINRRPSTAQVRRAAEHHDTTLPGHTLDNTSMAAPARDLKSDSATHSRKQDQQKPIIVAPAATDDASDPELRRARTRSRSPVVPRQDPNSPSIEAGPPLSATSGAAVGGPSSATRRRPDAYNAFPQPVQRDHLSPSSALGMGTAYWRGLSRSPSPLGLIPIHREWRHFVRLHCVCSFDRN